MKKLMVTLFLLSILLPGYKIRGLTTQQKQAEIDNLKKLIAESDANIKSYESDNTETGYAIQELQNITVQLKLRLRQFRGLEEKAIDPSTKLLILYETTYKNLLENKTQMSHLTNKGLQSLKQLKSAQKNRLYFLTTGEEPPPLAPQPRFLQPKKPPQ